MKNALIYSSSFAGHRQVYVFVLSHILRQLNYNIFIAGNFSDKYKSTFYIDKLKSDANIFRIDTSNYLGKGLGITNKELIELQANNHISLTIFSDADNHIPLFISQILPKHKRFIGKTVGIFLRPFYFYKKMSLVGKLKFIKYSYKVWDSDMRMFHEMLNPYLKLLNVSLHIDDYFASTHKKTVWLPDVFQQYADEIVMEEQSEQRKWLNRLDEFKKANDGSFIILYFGTEQKRRGYDQLLKLAIDHNACFIHCGLRVNNSSYDLDVNTLRQVLKDENRLFETNEYITDPICLEYFFKSVSHLILPYDNSFFGSSGVMLQALSYKIPVLVPDIGIIGYRVKKYNLGYTYGIEELEKQFLAFINTPIGLFSKSIDDYMSLHSNEKFKSVLINAFID